MELASRPIRREELQRGRNSPRNVTRDASLTLAARLLLHCAMIFIRVSIVVEYAREKFPRVRTRISRDLFRSSRGDNSAALLAAFRPEVDDPIGGFNDVEIVLDYQNRRTAVNQFSESGEQLLYVIEVQAGRGFVEDIQDTLVCLRGTIRCQFQALPLAARTCGRGLSKAEVAQSHFFQNSQLRSDLGNSAKKYERFANSH